MSENTGTAVATRGIARAAAGYFAAVFAAGFALGAARALWLSPQLGERAAQLLELPVMVGVAWAVARWRFGRDPVAWPPRRRLAVGALALALLLVAEVALGMALRGLTLRQVFLERDPVAGTAYLAALAAFALLPWLLSHRPR